MRNSARIDANNAKGRGRARSARNPRMARVARTTCCSPVARVSAASCASSSDHAQRKRRQATVHRQHALHQHHPRHRRAAVPGSREIERRIKSLVRWNALAMVVKANKADEGIGGHISTLRVSRDALRSRLQPLLQGQGRAITTATSSYFQGHAAPGIYARAFVEGRICRRRSSRTSGAS